MVKYLHGIKLIESDYGLYLYDAHGNVTEILDSDYDVCNSYTYDPFGDSIISTAESIIRDTDMESLNPPAGMQSFGGGQLQSGMIINHAPENPYRYCGEYTDLETGYVYLRARYYDPNLGRFISEDSAKDGYNWYVYCGNDPVNRVDPSGECAITALLIAISTLTLVTRVLSIINYEHNNALDIEDPRYTNNFIDNQNDGRLKEYMYGFQNMEENGCGVIAIHNVKYILEMNSTLADTVKSTQKAGGMVLFGVFGTYPWKIDNVLKKDGIDCERIRKDEINGDGIYIITYHYGKPIFSGVHNVVLKIEGDTKTIYNDDVYDDAYWNTRCFMQAYRIKND